MKILSKISVPKSFINSYIKNIISYFEKEKGVNEKNKRAKFICHFIMKLIDNNILTKNDELPEEINQLFKVDKEEISNLKKKLIEFKQNP